ncbi:ribonuclease E [Desulfosarcina sp. BuS5]|uniref:Rne/Rng family ribonuclease n=1 Tax=Desulfosarcina sp. BuS5 TaxID=933262 RepID=UPI000489175A|nr:Rne/Rng family ribonuclease [Desulfosarcina sp. BuS5]WDN89480.1 ribonuclease E [Desulfosarcina sp. BuS5]
MSVKILVNAVDPEECRIATIRKNKLDGFYIDRASKAITHGNIYKGIITRIEPSLQAVFVDYGAERHGFLGQKEIHSDYYQDNPSRSKTLSNLVKTGQELIVQITKDPFMKKGAMLTTYISLPGRYVVLMPGTVNKGISRKIEDEKERSRLKNIIERLKLPEGFGLIVRTAGEKCTTTSISKDMSYLLRLWKNINKNVTNEKAPCLLYKERNLVLRSLRDYFTPDVTEILIDNDVLFREAKNFIKIIAPKETRIVKLYKGAKPIFSKYQLENQIASIFQSRVGLKSGGSIVIEQTEALVAIDVNSGKATKEKSIEQTASHTNIEAAEEIARQLRLRDLGGLIVLDMIDMRDRKHKAEVEKALKLHLRIDKAKTKIGKISQFGLIEMSRQRIRPSIEFSSFETCKHCQGKGQIPSPETRGLSFLRELSATTLKSEMVSINCIVPVDVAEYLLNKKRKELVELETSRGIQINIVAESSMTRMESKIDYC